MLGKQSLRRNAIRPFPASRSPKGFENRVPNALRCVPFNHQDRRSHWISSPNTLHYIQTRPRCGPPRLVCNSKRPSLDPPAMRSPDTAGARFAPATPPRSSTPSALPCPYRTEGGVPGTGRSRGSSPRVLAYLDCRSSYVPESHLLAAQQEEKHSSGGTTLLCFRSSGVLGQSLLGS